MRHQVDSVLTTYHSSVCGTAFTLRCVCPVVDCVRHQADYVLLRRENFTVTVKLTSNRTMNTECIARENRRGRHLGQGTIFVYRRGDEMHNLAPVLDWKGLGKRLRTQSRPHMSSSLESSLNLMSISS